MTVERKLYLELCRETATLRGGIENIKLNVPDRLRVVYKGDEYYPVAYELGFQKDGSATHTAIIHEMKANAIHYVALDKLEQKENT